MTAESTPSRMPPQERREQILQSAIRLFEERPHTSVSTTEIAAAASRSCRAPSGCSKSARTPR